MDHASAPAQLRIFIASPGDVADERALAKRVIADINGDPAYRDRVRLEVVAWDRERPVTPLEAVLSPQEAIARDLPRPSDCDVVAVILWSRLGTALDRDAALDPPPVDESGNPRTGTTWEYADALTAAERSGSPRLWVYRKTKRVPPPELDDPEESEKRRQYRAVKAFFDDLTARNRGFNEFAAPSDFQTMLSDHLRELLVGRLAEQVGTTGSAPRLRAEWAGRPYPGLAAFTADEAPIFFGRDAETDQLVARLGEGGQRFLVVVGGSGTGKSSLVAAGLLPRLRTGAVPGSGGWVYLPRFTPALEGDGAAGDPFRSLASALCLGVPRLGRPARLLGPRLREEPATLDETLAQALEAHPTWAELLVFIDQFEELVTLVPPETAARFADLLGRLAGHPRCRLVVTLRADFLHRIARWPALADLLTGNGTVWLKPPGLTALRQMIEGPAHRAGIALDPGLADRLIEDTGTEPGSMALMAFTLERLWLNAGQRGPLTLDAYTAMGGVAGAIARQASLALAEVGADAQAAVQAVFRELLTISADGAVTRRRAPLAGFDAQPAAAMLMAALIRHRLLTVDQGGLVSVAHEALFSAWQALAEWIDVSRDHLRRVARARIEAADWARAGGPEDHRRGDGWIREVLAAYAHLGQSVEDLDPDLQAFLTLESTRLIARLDDPATTPYQRLKYGMRLAELGDPRKGVGIVRDPKTGLWLPDIDWCEVPGGEFMYQDGERRSLPTFHMARYPVTNRQFECFVENGGYTEDRWWEGLAERFDGPDRPSWQEANGPRENVSWYEAVAFCRWLSERLGYEVRLPTEEEWEKAARGTDGREYPWGDGYRIGYANINEVGADLTASFLQRTTPVGLFPHAASPCGALDLAGNLLEWCLNEYENPERIGIEGSERRVLRGGSWDSYRGSARASFRGGDPGYRSGAYGFRVVCVSPIHSGH